jgi:hypothetical protein
MNEGFSSKPKQVSYMHPFSGTKSPQTYQPLINSLNCSPYGLISPELIFMYAQAQANAQMVNNLVIAAKLGSLIRQAPIILQRNPIQLESAKQPSKNLPYELSPAHHKSPVSTPRTSASTEIAQETSNPLEKEKEVELETSLRQDPEPTVQEETIKSQTSTHKKKPRSKNLPKERTSPRAPQATHSVRPQKTDPMKVMETLRPEVEGLVGYKTVDMAKMFRLLTRSDNDPNKFMIKLKRNLYYYKHEFKSAEEIEA